MWKMTAVVMLASVFFVVGGVLRAAEEPPAWAYNALPAPSPGAPPAQAAAPPPEDTSLKRLSGSGNAFTLAQIRDAFGPADWYPGDHPLMPEVVARGRRPDVRA